MSKRKNLARVYALVTVAGAVALGALVSLWVDFPLASLRLDAAEERARQAGVPLTLADLGPERAVPPHLNAAPGYFRVFAGHSGELSIAVKGMEDAIESDGKGAEELMRIAETVAAPAAELHKASLLPYYYRETDVDLGMHLLFPEVAQILNSAKFFSLRGVGHARLGSVEEAATDLATARRIARHISQNPVVISALVGVAAERYAMWGVQSAAMALAHKPEALDYLGNTVMAVGVLPTDYLHAMRTEAYFGIVTARNLDVHAGTNPAVALVTNTASFPGMDEHALGYAYELLARHGLHSAPEGWQMDMADIRRSGQPPGWVMQGSLARTLDAWAAYFEALPKSGANVADFERAMQRRNQALNNERLSYVLAREMSSSKSVAPAVLLTPKAVHQKTSAYIAVLQYRNQHGQWPDTLEQAGVQVMDPFDGKPLRYRIEADGFVIWSIGTDNLDEGGDARRDLLAAYRNPPSTNRHASAR